MIVNAAIFTCSICGEASANICAYCTKDACSNHRCERCKRCSDCCECDSPLSAEELVAPLEIAQVEVLEPEADPAPADSPALEAEAGPAATSAFSFLTPEEASVFAPESSAAVDAPESSNPFDATDPEERE
jgi:hypothetical protein